MMGVASERGREPGDPRIRIGTLRRVRDQHVKVRHGAAHDLVEHGIRSLDARRSLARLAQRLPRGAHAPVEEPSTPIAFRAIDRAANEDAPRRSGLEQELVYRARRGQGLGRGREGDTRAALHAIQTRIREGDAVIALERCARLAVHRAMLASHFEQIREVGCEAIRQAQLQRAIAEIADQHPLVARAAPDEADAVHVDILTPERDLALDHQVRIAEVGGEHRIVVLRHRAQQKRTRLLQQQLKLR